MEVICKPSMNVIFWKEGRHNDWKWADLDEIIQKYEDEPYTELEFWKTVKSEETGKELYHVFFCKECEQPVLAVDINHGYEFCPHCGRAIWSE